MSTVNREDSCEGPVRICLELLCPRKGRDDQQSAIPVSEQRQRRLASEAVHLATVLAP